MSEPEASEPEAQPEFAPGTPGGEQGRPSRVPPPGKKRGFPRSGVIGIIGGLAMIGIIGGILVPNIVNDKPPVTGEESTLEVLLPGDINAALPTLDPGSSKAAVDDAKNCRVPMAWVTLVQRNGHSGLVRIRSGAYQSPPIKLTPVPQRVAVPYPAPYPTGRGVLTLVGEADQVGFYLTPGGIHDVNGAYSVNVHWQVRNPCP